MLRQAYAAYDEKWGNFDDPSHIMGPVISKKQMERVSGGVSSGDLHRALRIANRIRAGSISVNGGMCIAGDLPFGGYKASGIGREWGVAGIEEFLETKAIAWRI